MSVKSNSVCRDKKELEPILTQSNNYINNGTNLNKSQCAWSSNKNTNKSNFPTDWSQERLKTESSVNKNRSKDFPNKKKPLKKINNFDYKKHNRLIDLNDHMSFRTYPYGESFKYKINGSKTFGKSALSLEKSDRTNSSQYSSFAKKNVPQLKNSRLDISDTLTESKYLISQEKDTLKGKDVEVLKLYCNGRVDKSRYKNVFLPEKLKASEKKYIHTVESEKKSCSKIHTSDCETNSKTKVSFD